MQFHLKTSLFIILFSLSICVNSQIRTQAFEDNIHTLRAQVNQNEFASPILDLTGEKTLTISFDEINSSIQNYYYSVQQCNADWTPSVLTSIEWCNGINYGPINNINTSANTSISYTHYEFSLPNEDTHFKLSGNYVVSIYDISNPDKTLATVCFSVVEPKVTVNATVKGNTDIDINGKMQQLDFTISPNSFSIENPMNDINVTVRQNNRIDNEVSELKPTYIAPGKLTFTNNKALIFDGGNEYKSFDMSSRYNFSGNIENIRFYDPYFHVQLMPDNIEPRSTYNFINDVDGSYKINLQEYDNDKFWADYYLVHFSIPAEAPFFDGLVYVLGEFNNNKLNSNSRMDYNNQTKSYEKSILLKQGGYNYQYVFVPKGEKAGSMARIAGSHWQTENEYEIYVYYRAFGERYDRLIAFKVLKSGGN